MRKIGLAVTLAMLCGTANLPALAGPVDERTSYSIEKHLIFADPEPKESDKEGAHNLQKWSDEDKKVVSEDFKRLETLAIGLLTRATAYRPIRLWRVSSDEHPAAADTSRNSIGFYDKYFSDPLRAGVLVHELTHLADHGFLLSPSQEWARLVVSRCDPIIAKISGGNLRQFQALVDDGGGRKRASESEARQQGMPSLYSCKNQNEALAEHVLFAVYPDYRGESFKAPEDITAFIHAHFLDKTYKPEKYLQDYYEAVSLFQNSKYTESIEAFTRLLSAHPELQESYYFRALARTKQALISGGDYDGALSDLDRATEHLVQARDLYNLDDLTADRTKILGLKTAQQAEVRLQAGVAAYKKGDYATAMKELKPLAEAGNATAQATLGKVYANSQGAARDDGEAVKWLRKAAAQGDGPGRYSLGVMYQIGRGVSRDEAEAAKLYLEAAGQGIGDAQYRLALMYMNGQGVTKDLNEAKKWHSKAARGGNQQALALYVQAAEQGNADAQYFVAEVYFNVESVKNVAEAVKLFHQAANQGHVNAQLALGGINLGGLGVPKDTNEAVKWFSKAAAQGNESAKAELKRLGRPWG